MLCLALGASLARADSTPPAAAPAVAGTWQKHEYSFAFLGFTSTYSCDGLADKLKLLLVTSGARPDAVARPGACASNFGRPDKFASASLVFYTLSPTAGTASDAPPVDGVWRTVALAARSPRVLELGDCELIEQFKSNVLPMFSTRNVESHTTCVPHQLSGSSIDLKFDAFAAAPKALGAAPPVAQQR
jgi:hypothetical protein